MNDRLLPKITLKNILATTTALQEHIKSNDIFSASVIAKTRHDILVEFLSDKTLGLDKKLAFAKELYNDVQSEIATIEQIASQKRSAFISRKNAYKAYSTNT